jgi:hypothetical protein
MSRPSSSKRGKSPFKQKRSMLNVETLEGRALPSCNTISGFVYHDANDNGLFDAGENPIANSSIELRNDGGTVVGTTTTDANGFYQFSVDASKPGLDKTLVETVTFDETQTNFTLDGLLNQFDPALGTLESIEIHHAGSITSDIKVENFSHISASNISATVSGNLTLTAPGVNDVLTISDTAGQFSAASYDGDTDFDGASGMSFGANTADGSNTITLTGDALNAYIGTGQVTVTESAVATSNASGGGNLDVRIRSTGTSTITVTYKYKEAECLEPGDYQIVQTVQPDTFLDGHESKEGSVIPNSDTTDFIDVTLDATDLVNNNFGELKNQTISGHVWHDANNDGVRDAAEDPIADTLITLEGPGGPRTTTTDANGYYEFTDLDPGTYTVRETQPANYLDGKDNAGTTGGTVVNDAAEDQIQDIVLNGGDSSQNNDFGELKPASLQGHVYHDLDDDGSFDIGEPPIPGTTVTLSGFDDEGPVSATAITDANGEYKFTDLRPGTYAITEAQPGGYDDGKDAVGSQGGTLGNDVISAIDLQAGVDGINNDFGELKADGPGDPLVKNVLPLGQLPAISKAQLTSRPTAGNMDPALRGQMAFVVGTQVTLLGVQPNLVQTLAGVGQVQSAGAASYVQAMWATDEHRAMQANSLYQSVLNRAPDAAELASTMQDLRNGVTEMEVKETLFISAEYAALHPTASGLAIALYEDILNKTPGTQSLAATLQSMANDPLQDVVHSLLTSDEALASQIDDAYRLTVRRAATDAEVQTWTSQIRGGTLTLDELAQRLLSSAEFYQLTFINVT